MDLLKARERARKKALEEEKTKGETAEPREPASLSPKPEPARSQPAKAKPRKKKKEPAKAVSKIPTAPSPAPAVPREIMEDDIFSDDSFGEGLPTAAEDSFESLADLILVDEEKELDPVPDPKPASGRISEPKLDDDGEPFWEDELERFKQIAVDQEERVKPAVLLEPPSPEKASAPKAPNRKVGGSGKSPSSPAPASGNEWVIDERKAEPAPSKKPARIEMEWEEDQVSLDEIAPGEEDFFSLVTEDLYLREFGRQDEFSEGEQFALLSFRLARETYAVRLTSIRQIIKITPITMMPRVPGHVLGIISLRGMIIPVFDLRRMLKLPEAEPTRKTRIIIVTEGKFTAGLIVDEVEEVVRTAESKIEPPPSTLAGIEAEYIKGIGRIGSKMIILLALDKVMIPVTSIKAGK